MTEPRPVYFTRDIAGNYHQVPDEPLRAQPAAEANPKTCGTYCAEPDGHICTRVCALKEIAS